MNAYHKKMKQLEEKILDISVEESAQKYNAQMVSDLSQKVKELESQLEKANEEKEEATGLYEYKQE